MEVIEKMPDVEREAICDAGVDLVREIQAILERRGLDRCHAFNVLVVAAAGVAAASSMTSDELAEGVNAVIHMWRVHEEDGRRAITFDPSRLPAGAPVEERPAN